MCFRPLARWIGLYLDEVKNYDSFAIDRFRPLARWIGLYQMKLLNKIKDVTEFPSPREVDRFISELAEVEKKTEDKVSVPSRGG